MPRFESRLKPFRPGVSPPSFFTHLILLQALYLFLAQEGLVLEDMGSFLSPRAHNVSLT